MTCKTSPRRALPGLVIAALLAAAVPPPAMAQDADTPDAAPPAAEEEALTELGDAARRAVEDMLEQLRPMFDAMRGAISELNAYGAPRMLPNGDILIPRKRPDSEADPEAAPEGDTLDL